MGSVFKVRDIALDEIIALKTLHPDLSRDERALARFRREVKLARRVTHPNVARTYDLGTDEAIPYLTMEFIEGDPLGIHVVRHGPLRLAQILELATHIARGLGAAHAAGVVHRDLKPPNIMVSAKGRVVLTDFGIARAAQSSSAMTSSGLDGLVGTPMYMAPEQVRGHEDIDHRADLYALGVILYELLAGRPSLRGRRPHGAGAGAAPGGAPRAAP